MGLGQALVTVDSNSKPRRGILINGPDLRLTLVSALITAYSLHRNYYLQRFTELYFLALWLLAEMPQTISTTLSY